MWFVVWVMMMSAYRSVLPFSAQYEETQAAISGGAAQEAATVARWRVWRDSQGRLRQEVNWLADSSESIRLAIIIDPSSGRMALIDVASGKALDEGSSALGSLPEGLASLGMTPEGGGTGTPATVPLGDRLIEGQQARGERLILEDRTVEIWRSPALIDFPLLIRTTTATEERTRRLFDIEFIEPDPSLFKIP